MTYYIVKLLLSAGIIVAVSEIGKRSPTLGSLLISIPVVSILAIFWLYWDTQDTAKVGALMTGTFWLVLPSLPMFLLIPWLFKKGLGFFPAMGIGCILTITLYFGMLHSSNTGKYLSKLPKSLSPSTIVVRPPNPHRYRYRYRSSPIAVSPTPYRYRPKL